jgi:hypothetical protein
LSPTSRIHAFSPCQTCTSTQLAFRPEIYNYPFYLKAMLHRANKASSSTRNANESNQGFSTDFCFVVHFPTIASVFVASAACMAKPIMYSYVSISATRFTMLLFAPRLLPSSCSPNGLRQTAPGLRSIPNIFGWILEGNTVAARKSLTCLPRIVNAVEQTAPNLSHQNGISGRIRFIISSRSAPHDDNSR